MVWWDERQALPLHNAVAAGCGGVSSREHADSDNGDDEAEDAAALELSCHAHNDGAGDYTLHASVDLEDEYLRWGGSSATFLACHSNPYETRLLTRLVRCL